MVALWIGSREVILGRITLGQFVAFTVYLGMLNWPMVALGWVINLFQRGAASLAVSLLLLMAMLLGAAYAHRAVLSEQRASADQQRATQAFEAAEAGIAWAIAQLNGPRPVDARCEPLTDASGSSFRERYLSVDTDSGLHTPRLWKGGAQDIALQPGCVRSGQSWSCACPSNGWPDLPAASGGDLAPQPAFSVQYHPEASPGPQDSIYLFEKFVASLGKPA